MEDNILNKIKNDGINKYIILEVLKMLTEKNFDEIAFTTSLIDKYTKEQSFIHKSNTFDSSLKSIGDSIHEIETFIGQLVSENQQTLLENIENTITIKQRINPFCSELSEIKMLVSQLSEMLRVPYESMEEKIVQLDKIQEILQYLRVITRILASVKKIQFIKTETSISIKDIVKASTGIQEIQMCLKSIDCIGINILIQPLQIFRETYEIISERAIAYFNENLEAQNQVNTVASIQIFFNIGILKIVLEDLIKSKIKYIQDLIINIVNIGVKQFMEEFKLLFDIIYQICLQITTLHRILNKRKDNFNKYTYTDIIQISIINIFSTELQNSFNLFGNSNLQIYNKIISDYPKILEVLDNVYNKLLHAGTNVTSTYGSWKKEIFINPFLRFENEYKKLQKSNTQ